MKKRLLGVFLVVGLLLTTVAPILAEIEPFGEGKTLSFACLEGWYSAVSINDNLPIWQEFERRTGVHIEFEAFGDYNAAMQPRVAAGQDLPDIMLVPPAWGNSGVYRLAADGLIIPIDELITEHAPNIVTLLDDNPALKGLLTAPDGRIYTVADSPMFVNDMVIQNGLFIRQDWLDALGLPVSIVLENVSLERPNYREKMSRSETGIQKGQHPTNTAEEAMDMMDNASRCPHTHSHGYYDEDG